MSRGPAPARPVELGSLAELAGLQAHAVALLIAAVPGGRTVGGVGAAIGGAGTVVSGVVGARSGMPHPLANGLVVVSGDDPAELAPALGLLAGVPYAAQLAADRHPRTRAALAGSGHRLVETSPAMAFAPSAAGASASAALPDGLVVRTAPPGDSGTLAAALHLSAEVFGVEPAVMAAAYGSQVVAAAGVTTWVGEVAREVVTTAQTYRVGDAALLVNVATAGSHRRCGHGTAVSARAVAELLGLGCRRVWLVSSRPGVGVYQRLGFRTAGAWQTWLSPAAEAGPGAGVPAG